MTHIDPHSLALDGLSKPEAARRVLLDGKFPRRHREQLRGLPWIDAQKAAMKAATNVVRRAGLAAIIGGRGRGKTLMATCVAYWLPHEHEYLARYWTFGDLLADYRDKVYRNKMSEAGWFSKAVAARCVVIDELGERRSTEDEALFLTRVLDYRYRNVRGTIVIANTTQERLPEDLGPSAANRLCEGGQVIECLWDSFRGGGAA